MNFLSLEVAPDDIRELLNELDMGIKVGSSMEGDRSRGLEYGRETPQYAIGWEQELSAKGGEVTPWFDELDQLWGYLRAHRQRLLLQHVPDDEQIDAMERVKQAALKLVKGAE